MDNKTYMRWDEIKASIKRLAYNIQTTPNVYSSVFGIPRGGIHVAQELSKELNIPIVSVPKTGTLIVDDIYESGRTLHNYASYHTAVIFVKKDKGISGLKKPTYFSDLTDKWIVFPWETKDGVDEGIQTNVLRMIEYAGEDPSREGLRDTPKRFENAWNFYTSGYKQRLEDIATAFDNPSNGKDGNPSIDQIVIIPKIDFYSLCEHHLAPFYGQVHIGYLPKKKVLGLSKFARITNMFSRRLQIQERLTQEIAEAIMTLVDPLGVGVVIRGVHLCMRSRGVEKQNSEMVTSVQLGYFRDKPEARAEFLSLLNE